MTDLFLIALDRVDMGVSLVDENFNIIFWNKYLEKISGVNSQNVINKKIHDITPIINKSLFQNSIQTVLQNHQSRFFSSKIHKAFIKSANAETDKVRQNMKIEPIMIHGEVYAYIQIDDVTNEVVNERKLISFINELKKDYLEIKESDEIIKTLAITDFLTGLYNRHSITQHINALLDGKTDLSNYAVMFLDLDGFKHINDTYGHNSGDIVLIKVADKLRKITRDDDVAARLGGDEFVILLRFKSIGDVSDIANRLIKSIAEPILIDGYKIEVTASIGISVFTGDVTSTSEIIGRADSAMYLAKKQGKNSFTFYN